MDDLKSKLASQEVELAQKNEAANKLIQVVGAETEKVRNYPRAFTNHLIRPCHKHKIEQTDYLTFLVNHKLFNIPMMKRLEMY